MEADDHSGISLPSGSDGKKRRVTYFYDPEFGDYEYSPKHFMKPIRVRMANSLIHSYNLHERMDMNVPNPCKIEDMLNFHSHDYVKFLSSVSPETLLELDSQRFGVSAVDCPAAPADCPAFDGLFRFCQTSASGSIGAAVKLNRGDADIALNWAGGLHHAKKSSASGFCYINDIVLGIFELLKVYKRVLYVDIDVHHGDGVEEAFYDTDRVMTVSFHKYDGEFFPGTGKKEDIGIGPGKNYSLNVPLKNGIDDESFRGIFRPIIEKVNNIYQPEAVVLQSGADSLSGDRVGHFNLSTKGHADCLRFIRSFNIPLMVLGGGGYTIANVARCWCYETAVAVGVELANEIPQNNYFNSYTPDFNLHVEPSNMRNQNSKKYLDDLRIELLKQISKIPSAPNVPIQERPPDTQIPEEDEDPMDGRAKYGIWDGESYGSTI